MGARQRAWAVRARAQLVQDLGGKCVDCGSTNDLELDCVMPQGPAHHGKMESSVRIGFYRRQHAQGNLACRCSTCNGRKGALDDKWEHEAAESEAIREADDEAVRAANADILEEYRSLFEALAPSDGGFENPVQNPSLPGDRT